MATSNSRGLSLACTIAVALALPAPHTTAQTVASPIAPPIAPHAPPIAPLLQRGAHFYTSQGSYDGEMGPPWDSVIEVSDTTLNGVAAVALTQRSHRTGGTYAYNTTVVWSPTAGTLAYRSAGDGTEPGSCAIEAITADGDAARGRLVIEGGATEPVMIAGKAVPEFSLASILAAGQLADGDHPKFTAFRCSWSGSAPTALSAFKFNGTVKSDSLERGNSRTKEAVWTVTGAADYPFVATIAKSDREVLKVVIPQGSVGAMYETFLRSLIRKQ
jgi:hypothetical protein